MGRGEIVACTTLQRAVFWEGRLFFGKARKRDKCGAMLDLNRLWTMVMVLTGRRGFGPGVEPDPKPPLRGVHI